MNVRQPNHILANSFTVHKAERRPGADEEWLPMAKHDGMEVESILINQTKIGQAPCQVWSGNVNLPIELRLQPAYRRLDVILDECDVGADRLQRARHHPLPLTHPHRRKVAILCVRIRKVIVPITHDLVHAATVHGARQAARLLHEVTGERGTGWPNSHVVDVAVEGLVQSIHELCHATKPPSQVLQNRPWGILRGFLIDAIAAISTITRIARSWRTRSVARIRPDRRSRASNGGAACCRT